MGHRSHPSLLLPAGAIRWGLPLAAILGFAGCKFLESASATVIASGLVIASPAIQLQGQFNVKAEVAATSWVGERASATSTEEPKPISDADVTLRFAGSAVTLSEDTGQPGVYLNTSIQDAALTYKAGESYVFDAVAKGQTYGGSVTAPLQLTLESVTYSPAPTTDPRFPAEVGAFPKSTALTMTWSNSHGRYAYVSVFRADRAKPDQPQLVFDTRPKTAGEIIQFITGNAPTQIQIPADTFNTDGVYAVVLVTVDKGNPKANTFLGTPILAGSGVVRILAVGDVTFGG